MKFILLSLLLFTSQAYASEQISALMETASERDDINEDLFERLEDEEQRWKADKEVKRKYWRHVFFQTHHHPTLKNVALCKWIDTYEFTKVPHKEIEDAAVHAHYEFLQAKNEQDAVSQEHWSDMISKIANVISNLEESKSKKELIKILQIRIAPEVQVLFF